MKGGGSQREVPKRRDASFSSRKDHRERSLRLTNSVVRRYLSETFAVPNVSLFVLFLSLSFSRAEVSKACREDSLVTVTWKKKNNRGIGREMKIVWIERSIENLARFSTLYATRPHIPRIPSPRRTVEKLVAKKHGGNVATLCARVEGAKFRS